MKHPVLMLMVVSLFIPSCLVGSESDEKYLSGSKSERKSAVGFDLSSDEEFPPLTRPENDEIPEEIRSSLAKIEALRIKNGKPKHYLKMMSPPTYSSTGETIAGRVFFVHSQGYEALPEEPLPQQEIQTGELKKIRQRLQPNSKFSFEIAYLRNCNEIERVKKTTENNPALTALSDSKALELDKLKNEIKERELSRVSDRRQKLQDSHSSQISELNERHEAEIIQSSTLSNQQQTQVATFNTECKALIAALSPNFYSVIKRSARRTGLS